MTEVNPYNVKPLYKDKYYVYALCKPDGSVFYIGKGKGQRINHHFQKYSMSKKSYKNNVIKSYGSERIKREILCYFDSEDSAYAYEEWLISQYGIHSEGGMLTNIYKSNSEFKGNGLEISQECAVKSRRVNVPNHIAVGVLFMWFTMCKTITEIVSRYGYTNKVLYKIVRNQKNFEMYEKYITSGIIKNNRGIRKVYRPNHSARIASDEDLIKYHKLFVDGEMSMKNISKEMKMSERSLIQIFRGDTRTYLNLSVDNRLFTYNRAITKSEAELIIKRRVLENISYAKLAKDFDKSERVVQRVCKLEGQYRVFKDYKEGLEFEKQN